MEGLFKVAILKISDANEKSTFELCKMKFKFRNMFLNILMNYSK